MHSMKHEAHASAKAKMSRMAGSRGVAHAGTPDIGDGVEESYGNVAAGHSSSARFARGGHVEGDPAMRRLDRKPRGKFAHGGAVKGKGKTIVNINVGQPQGQQAMPVPVPVPAGGPPPGAQMPPLRPPMTAPQGMPPGAGPMPSAGMMPPPGAVPPGMIPGRKAGGRIPKEGGAASGVGRMEKAGLKVGAR